MPRNQSSTQSNATGAATARAAKPRTPRVTASKHNKAEVAESATVMVKESVAEHEVKEIIASLTESTQAGTESTQAGQDDPIDTISKIAYGYWEERGGAAGDPVADWARAEEEYRRRLASA